MGFAMETQTRQILYVFIFGMIGILGILRFVGIINDYQLVQLGLTTLLLYVTILHMIASILQAQTAKVTLKATVAPRILFRVRPANEYWNGPFGKQPKGWKKGVGIYIENVGLGHALNIKMSYKAVGEKDEHICKAEFGRLRVGETYALPSKQYPELEVKETHSRIVIDSVEYDDIRTPTNHYNIDEPEVINLNPAFFEEPDRPKNLK